MSGDGANEKSAAESLRPMGGGVQGRLHEPGRPAQVKVGSRSRRRWAEQGAKIDLLRRLRVVEMQPHALAQRRQLGSEGQVGTAARIDTQREVAPVAVQLLRHRKQRREPDAAGQEQVVPGLRGQGEGVAGAADGQQIPLGNPVVQRRRAAAALRLALDADAVAAG